MNLSSFLGIEQTNDLGSYLGASLLHQRVPKQSVSFILDKMKKKNYLLGNLKIYPFQGVSLSAQSCLYSIPGYVMQSMAIPASFCDEAEAIYTNYNSLLSYKLHHIYSIYIRRNVIIQTSSNTTSSSVWQKSYALVKKCYKLIIETVT